MPPPPRRPHGRRARRRRPRPTGRRGRGTDARHGGVLPDLDPARLGRRAEGLDERPVVDLVVLGREDGARQARRQHRLDVGRGVAREPLDRRPVLLLEREQAPQRAHAVAVVGDDQRALVAVADRPARGALPGRRANAGPPSQALAPQPVQVELLEPDLGRRRQHPGRRPRGAPPRAARVQDGHPAPLLGQAPRHAQPGDTAADDDDLGGQLGHGGADGDDGDGPTGIGDARQL